MQHIQSLDRELSLSIAYEHALNQIVSEEIAKYPTYTFLTEGHNYYIRAKLSLLNAPLVKVPLIIKKFSQYAPYVITQDVNAFI